MISFKVTHVCFFPLHFQQIGIQACWEGKQIKFGKIIDMQNNTTNGKS